MKQIVISRLKSVSVKDFQPFVQLCERPPHLCLTSEKKRDGNEIDLQLDL